MRVSRTVFAAVTSDGGVVVLNAGWSDLPWWRLCTPRNPSSLRVLYQPNPPEQGVPIGLMVSEVESPEANDLPSVVAWAATSADCSDAIPPTCQLLALKVTPL